MPRIPWNSPHAVRSLLAKIRSRTSDNLPRSVLAALVLMAGLSGQATQAFGQPERGRSSDAQGILRDARAALERGDQKEALSILARLADNDGASHFAAGAMLAESKAYAAAAREFGIARRTTKDPYMVGYDQTLAYVNSGDYPLAIRTANELLNQGYETAELASVVGTAYWKNGQTKEAYNAFRLATHLDPKDEESYIDLCEISLDSDNYDLGLEISNIGLSHLPNSERLYLERGVMHAMKGQYSQAGQDFSTAAKLAPKAVLPEVALGLASMQAGSLDEAVEILRSCANRHPESYLAQYWFAKTLMQSGARPGTKEGEEALAALEASVRLDPNYWHARADLGKVLLDRGDLGPAIAELEKAASLNPAATGPLYLLAQAYRRKGDNARAEQLAARVGKMQAQEREAMSNSFLKSAVREAITGSSTLPAKH